MLLVPDAQDASEVVQTGSIVWNNYNIEGALNKRGGAKNVMCTICDTAFTLCTSLQAFTHILGPAVLSHKPQISLHVCLYVKRMTVGIHNSKPRRKFSTIKS